MFDHLLPLTPPLTLSPSALVASLLFDIFLIVGLARLLGNFMLRIGQPRVVGEILAGILLGPTLLGKRFSQVLAPLPAHPALNVVATIGLMLFMFLAGIEYDSSKLKERGGQVVKPINTI